MWMPAQTIVAPLALARSAPRPRAPRREDERGVELRGRGRHRVARPPRAELARKAGRVVVSPAREGEYAPALVHRHLADDVGRGAEAVEAEPLGVAGHAQRAPADQ